MFAGIKVVLFGQLTGLAWSATKSRKHFSSNKSTHLLLHVRILLEGGYEQQLTQNTNNICNNYTYRMHPKK